MKAAYKSKSTSRTVKRGNLPPVGYFPPLLDEGDYKVQCIGFQISLYRGKQQKIYLYFDFFSSGKAGVFLFKAMNFPGAACSMNHEYFDCWVRLNGARPRSTKISVMNPDIFLNKILMVSVKTVKPKERDGSLKGDNYNYSKVDRIVSVGP